MKTNLWVVLIVAVSIGTFAYAREARKQAPKSKAAQSQERPASRPATTMTIEAKSETAPGRSRAFEAWLNRMKKRVATTQARQNKLIAVAAVRGDDSSDVPPLYWKGKESSGAVNLPELQEFDEAINMALAGDDAGARTKLESFLSTHASSPLAGDAQETLRMLSEVGPTP